MRVIKFRIWDIVSSSWLDNPLYDGVYWNLLRDLNENRDNGDVEIQQFIGLKDKNGKEIYEGDIVKVDEFDKLNHAWIGKITWIGTGFHIVNALSKTDEPDLLEFRRPIEIIGNIFENPELLINRSN